MIENVNMLSDVGASCFILLLSGICRCHNYKCCLNFTQQLLSAGIRCAEVENKAYGCRGWRASVSGDGEGRSICSAQNSVMAKQCGEMHPARASVLMRLTLNELSLPLDFPAFTTAAS